MKILEVNDFDIFKKKRNERGGDGGKKCIKIKINQGLHISPSCKTAAIKQK